MLPSEAEVESSAEQKIIDLLGKSGHQTQAVRLVDLQSLPEDERDAELVSKEKAARFSERMNNQLLKQLRDEHNLRKHFMPYVYWLVVGVIGSTLLLLVAAGCVNAAGRSFLSDKVLITLLTATVADILGIFFIAIKWLYPQSK